MFASSWLKKRTLAPSSGNFNGLSAESLQLVLMWWDSVELLIFFSQEFPRWAKLRLTSGLTMSYIHPKSAWYANRWAYLVCRYRLKTKKPLSSSSESRGFFAAVYPHIPLAQYYSAINLRLSETSVKRRGGTRKKYKGKRKKWKGQVKRQKGKGKRQKWEPESSLSNLANQGLFTRRIRPAY